MSNGVVIWEGLSPVDGAPIVAIAIVKSSNRKTGDMVQTYILRSDVSPMDAVRDGSDASICGDCPLRSKDGSGFKRRACYVNVGQGPRVVWLAYRRGNYPAVDPAIVGRMVSGRAVRLGTYGDPAMVPASVWQGLTAYASKHTGYTHQWRADFAQPLRGLLMASTHTAADTLEAWSDDWRTFRAGAPIDGLDETLCPASEEAGKKTTCAQCGLCKGSAPMRSVWINPHGSGRKALATTTEG